MANNLTYHERLVGLLVGGAVGDAIGLPAEGLSAERIALWWPGSLRHRFLFNHGMISDDTEHALMTAQALIQADGDVELFRRKLAWKLRWWILALPAGAGLATARASLRLWLGISPKTSGVNSAGNGAAMRSAIIGARFWNESVRRREFVAASSGITHTDKRAQTAALAVAEAAAWMVAGKPACHFVQEVAGLDEDEEWRRVAMQLGESLVASESVLEFAARLGLNGAVTGYAYHSVPVALYAWLRHGGDFSKTIESAIRCGGDTDTVAAIAGSLAGCEVGLEGIPQGWVDGIKDWPRSIAFVGQVAARLTEENKASTPIAWFWPAVIPRNLFFLGIFLFHGFRRLFPPYANQPIKG